LRFDLLSGENALNRGEVWIPVHQFEIPRELLDSIDVAATLDLHSNSAALVVARENIHRTDCRHVLSPDQGVAVAEQCDLLGEQFLEVGLHTELMRFVVENFVQTHNQNIVGLALVHTP
jgi:hypothetical protein